MLVWLGRLLLTLTAISLVTMPLTQHYWTWDRFLHGGQDFELGSLMVLSVLGLVLVLSKHGKQRMELLVSAWRFVGFHGKNLGVLRAFQREVGFIADPAMETHLSPVSYSLPLQI